MREYEPNEHRRGFEGWQARENENEYEKVEGDTTLVRRIIERDSDYRPRVIEQERGSQHQRLEWAYPDSGGYIERDVFTASDKETEIGKTMQREHPETSHAVSISFEDPDAGMVNLSVTAELETLGQTLEKGNGREPYAHFRITDPEALQAFANLRKEPNERGFFAVQRGRLGGPVTVEVYGREVTINVFNKLSVDYDQAGRPVKAVLHSYDWLEDKSSTK